MELKFNVEGSFSISKKNETHLSFLDAYDVFNQRIIHMRSKERKKKSSSFFHREEKDVRF